VSDLSATTGSKTTSNQDESSDDSSNDDVREVDEPNAYRIEETGITAICLEGRLCLSNGFVNYFNGIRSAIFISEISNTSSKSSKVTASFRRVKSFFVEHLGPLIQFFSAGTHGR
jgi:hypothetical protein